MSDLKLYDTTLRDGTQNPFVHFTTEGKLEATRILDRLGVDYIEGGFPQARGGDDYFSQTQNIDIEAEIAAFGMTPRNRDFKNNNAIKFLVDAGTDVVTLVAKTPEEQIRGVLGMVSGEYRKIVGETVKYLKSMGKKVIVDAEHFFDAYKKDPASAMELLYVCGDADWLVLCDTNGGISHRDVSSVVKQVIAGVGDRIGVHFHNDRGLAVVCTLEAVYAGARQLQGTINGIGERTGNANLVEIIGNLYEEGFDIRAKPERLTEASRKIEKLSGWSILTNAPFVGSVAFAHTAGMHSDAMLKLNGSCEHCEPEAFGNERTYPMSGQSGRAAIVLKLGSWGYEFRKDHPVVMGLLRDLNGMGYIGDAQFYQMFRRRMGGYRNPIGLEKIDVVDNITLSGSNPEAIVKVRLKGNVFSEVAEGDGPVDAIDNALRKALRRVYPEIDDVILLSYNVPPITGTGTDATVQVRTYFSDGKEKWDSFTSGTDILATSADALCSAYSFFLLRQEDKNR